MSNYSDPYSRSGDLKVRQLQSSRGANADGANLQRCCPGNSRVVVEHGLLQLLAVLFFLLEAGLGFRV